MLKKFLILFLLSCAYVPVQAAVTSTTPYAYYVGTGSVDDYDFTFPVLSQTDLGVYVTDTSGAVTTYTLGIDYTVALAGNGANGGTVTLSAGNLTSGYKIAILDQTPLTQPTVLTTSTIVRPTTVQTALDRLARQIQQVNLKADRAMRMPVHENMTGLLDVAEDRKGRMIYFSDVDGSPTLIPKPFDDSGAVGGDLTGEYPDPNVISASHADGFWVGPTDPGGAEKLRVNGDASVSGSLTASNVSGTNTGNVTLAAIGSTPNANGATITGQALNLEPASGSFGGIVTTGTQTFAGAKTFSDIITLPATTTDNASLNIPHGTAPTSPTNGDIWTTTSGIYVRVNGSTVGPLSTGGSSGSVKWIWSNTSSTTVANTTSETTLLDTGTGTKTVAANELQAGSIVRVTAAGSWNASDTSQIVSIRVKLGTSITLARAITTSNDEATSGSWRVKADFLTETAGVNQAARASFETFFGSATAGTVTQIDNTFTSTFDTTGTNDVNVTAQWSAASASNTIACSIAYIEILHSN